MSKLYQFVGGVGSYKFKIQQNACFQGRIQDFKLGGRTETHEILHDNFTSYFLYDAI
jgi:hypothetical protein